MKTSDLNGAALDWAVAKCKGYSEIKIYSPHRPNDRGWIEVRFNPEPKASTARFDPTENWAQGGPIIEREGIDVAHSKSLGAWVAGMGVYDECCVAGVSYGGHALEAAMRCYVATKLGDEIDIPKELI